MNPLKSNFQVSKESEETCLEKNKKIKNSQVQNEKVKRFNQKNSSYLKEIQLKK